MQIPPFLQGFEEHSLTSKGKGYIQNLAYYKNFKQKILTLLTIGTEETLLADAVRTGRAQFTLSTTTARRLYGSRVI
jgi:hypothetical protein